MSQLETVVSKNLAGWADLPRKDQLAVCSAVLAYTFRHETSSGLTSAVKKIDPDLKVKPVRMAVMGNGFVLNHLKCFTYAQAVTGKVRGGQFGLSDRDSQIARYALRTYPGFQESLKGLHSRGYKMTTPQNLSALVGHVIKEVDDYTSKFVYKKLRFVYQSQGLEPHDIKQDLFSWATYAVLRAYPQYESRLHAVNIAKQVIHNQGINLILSTASEGKQRISSNADGTFGSKVLPLHLIGTGAFLEHSSYLSQCNYLVSSIDGSSAGGSTVDNIQDRFELKRSVTSVYRSIEDPRLRRLMKLWSGEWDDGFSAYLGVSNDDWFEEVPASQYLIECAKYLQIPGREAKIFLETLRGHLKDYK